ncbi:MAG: hypothetical protein IIX02_03430, partial [Clostridia bacterium]|nr:hypothetical protein [Clostridia bacterium]
MKKNTISKLIRSMGASLVFIFFGAIISGCSACNNVPKVVDYGFSQEEINVEQYSLVVPEMPLVLLDNGEAAMVLYEVVDSANQYVQVSSGSFLAEDINGYTINYAFIYEQKQIAHKDVKVNVLGSAFEVTAEYTEYIDTGALNEIQANVPADAEISYKVSYGEEEISVVDGAFVAENVGEYLIEIAAKKDGEIGRYSYTTFARTPSLQGEVEKFDENWEAVRTKSGIKNATDYKVVNSANTSLAYGEKQGEKLLDRFGQEANFLAYETTGNPTDSSGNNYLWMNLNIRNDLSYYKQLAEDGYEYVSIWVYLDSQNYHHNEMKGTPLASYDMFDISSYHGKISAREEVNYNPVLQPNQWTELKLGLYQAALGRRANRISFITSYSYYKDGGEFLVIDNSNYPSDDRHTEPGKMSVYVSDISVVR